SGLVYSTMNPESLYLYFAIQFEAAASSGRTCYASSATTYTRAPLESLAFVAPTANCFILNGIDKGD
nr:hypothetical protein [Tanacetum cinerariifolium]